MMDMPFVTRWGFMLALFAGAVVFLHLLLLKLPGHTLSKKRWAYIEYVQVALAALGLLGAVSQVRQMMAQNLMTFSQEHIRFDFDQLKSVATDYATPGAMMCLRLQSSPLSPLARSQRRRRSMTRPAPG
jgi:hypothetical protein